MRIWDYSRYKLRDTPIARSSVILNVVGNGNTTFFFNVKQSTNLIMDHHVVHEVP
jgi:hypothetical protein